MKRFSRVQDFDPAIHMFMLEFFSILRYSCLISLGLGICDSKVVRARTLSNTVEDSLWFTHASTTGNLSHVVNVKVF